MIQYTGTSQIKSNRNSLTLQTTYKTIQCIKSTVDLKVQYYLYRELYKANNTV